MKTTNFSQYIKEILKYAEYRKGNDLNCVVATVPILPGCMTQGDSFEDARANLIDAIELWITVGLREREEMPVVNGYQLASAVEIQEEVEAGVSYA
jgi:predicted RNase H-like HicB family nuclease